MNTAVLLLTEELLATFTPDENRQGRALANVRVRDGRRGEVECDVWIYPKGVYLHDQDCFIITDITSNRNFSYMEAHRRSDQPELDYAEHVRHLRLGLSQGAGKAIVGRDELIEALRTGNYHVG